MSAIIRSGGKQYRVEVGQHVVIERLVGEAGADVTFDEVLSMGDGDTIEIGTPTLAGVSVHGKIVEQKRGRKILVFRRKRRKNFRRLNGHRQYQTVVEITAIGGPAPKKAAKEAAAQAAPDAAAKPEQAVESSEVAKATTQASPTDGSAKESAEATQPTTKEAATKKPATKTAAKKPATKAATKETQDPQAKDQEPAAKPKPKTKVKKAATDEGAAD